MKKNLYPLFLMVLISAVSMSGCLTSKSMLVLQDEPIKTAEAEKIKVTARFLDEPTLSAKFGERSNPFLTDYFAIQLKRIMVFELTVENLREESVGLVSKRMEVQFGGVNRSPYNRFQLTNYWDVKQEDKVKSVYIARRNGVINDWVLPNELTISPGGKVKGYAVFLGNFPSFGTAGLYVPVLQSEQYIIHRFEFDFIF